MSDPLAPARGVLNALALAIPIDLLIGAICWWGW